METVLSQPTSAPYAGAGVRDAGWLAEGIHGIANSEAGQDTRADEARVCGGGVMAATTTPQLCATCGRDGPHHAPWCVFAPQMAVVAENPQIWGIIRDAVREERTETETTYAVTGRDGSSYGRWTLHHEPRQGTVGMRIFEA